MKANNVISSIVATEISTGAYVQVLSQNTARQEVKIKATAATHIVFGGALPTDDTRAYTMAASEVLTFYKGVLGPVYARSVAAASTVNVIAG
jgi:hypothetical protein